MGMKINMNQTLLAKYFGLSSHQMALLKAFKVEATAGFNTIKLTRPVMVLTDGSLHAVDPTLYSQVDVALPVSVASLYNESASAENVELAGYLVRASLDKLFKGTGLTMVELLEKFGKPDVSVAVQFDKVAEPLASLDAALKAKFLDEMKQKDLAKAVHAVTAPADFGTTEDVMTQTTTVAGVEVHDLLPPKKKAAIKVPAVTKMPSIKDAAKLPKVHLNKAEALGQKVMGTSQTATYRVIAVGEHLKIAAKFEDGKLSLRAEGDIDISPTAIALKQIGFVNGGEYWSVHMALGNVPPARVVGGVLLSLPPGVITKQVMNAEDLHECFA